MKDTSRKTNRLIVIVMAVLMSLAMGIVASVIVYNTPGAVTPPFPILCMLNVGESVVVGVLIALFIPFHKLGMYFTRNIKRGSLLYVLLFSIPYSIGNGVIVSTVVSFVNIAAAHSRIDPAYAPPLFIMWFMSWKNIIIPMVVIGYFVSVLITPLAIFTARYLEEGDNSGKKFKWFQIELLIVFAVVIAGVTAVLDMVVIERSKRTIKDKVSELIAANSNQIELNINTYLERMETTSTLLYTDEIYYTYDETDPSYDDYDKIKNEERISDRIVDIGLMNNYSDFGIIYSDDHKVGWVSHGTLDMFEDGGLYETFSSYITDSARQDAWCFGVKDSDDRIYYIKRLNDNAILLSSSYTIELSSVFVFPEQLEDMNVRLADENGRIIYSTNKEEFGGSVPDDLYDLLDYGSAQAGDSRTVVLNEIFVNMNVCSNGWRVLSSVPYDKVLKENDELASFTARISVLMAIIFVLVGLVFISRISVPVDDLVTTLQYKAEVDRLSGVMNKATFQEAVEERLREEDRIRAFVMMDMDNFKQVNDGLGHSYGDQVIIRFGKLLIGSCDEDALIGRLGGDEFAVYLSRKLAGLDDEKNLKEHIKTELDKVMELFMTEFEEERENCDLSVSAGVYVCNESYPTFKEMYDNADRALYVSKNKGKAQYTFFGEEDIDEQG